MVYYNISKIHLQLVALATMLCVCVYAVDRGAGLDTIHPSLPIGMDINLYLRHVGRKLHLTALIAQARRYLHVYRLPIISVSWIRSTCLRLLASSTSILWVWLKT